MQYATTVAREKYSQQEQYDNAYTSVAFFIGRVDKATIRLFSEHIIPCY